jgi:3-oxoadipate enol-lactonase
MKMQFEELGAGKPVVLLHAFPLTGKMWQPQIETLVQAGCRVITPDFRGFGENDNFADINTMEDLANDVGELLDNLEIEKAIIGGLSMGGYVAFNLYRLFPDKFAGIILADTSCAADTDEKRQSRFLLIEEIEKSGSQALIENMLPILTSDYTQTHNQNLITELQKRFSEVDSKGAIAAMRGMAERQDHCHILESISVPTLLIYGEHDAPFLEIARQMHKKIKFSKLVIIPHSGHYSNLEQPEQFNRALLEFVETVEI